MATIVGTTSCMSDIRDQIKDTGKNIRDTVHEAGHNVKAEDARERGDKLEELGEKGKAEFDHAKRDLRGDPTA